MLFREVHKTMNRLCVCRDWVALWFSSVVPSAAMTASALRRALRAEGYEPWPEAETELFFSGSDTLVIARPRGKTALCADSTE